MKRWLTMGAFLTALGVAHAQETCGYCFELKSARALGNADPTPEQLNGIRMLLATDAAPRISLAVPAETLLRIAHVCEGTVFQLASTTLTIDPSGSAPLTRPHLRVCDGTLVPLQEYREKPFKNFFDGEKRTLLKRIDEMASNATPERIDERLKVLLDDDKGPLYKRKLDWAARTAEDAAQLIARKPPAPRK